MSKRVLATVQDVMEEFQVSSGQAYKIIRELNKELKAAGFRTIQGRIHRGYLLERYAVSTRSLIDKQQTLDREDEK